MSVEPMTKRWRRNSYFGDRWGDAIMVPSRRTLTDAEVVRAYHSNLPPAEAAAFIAGLGWGLGHGESWIADTVRRLLPERLGRFEEVNGDGKGRKRH